jgi:hypothetical protein
MLYPTFSESVAVTRHSLQPLHLPTSAKRLPLQTPDALSTLKPLPLSTHTIPHYTLASSIEPHKDEWASVMKIQNQKRL